jgi:hypothetical protein
MTNFKQLKIWQKGLEIAIKGYRLTSGFPPQEKFGLGLQINKAGVSIPSNIAEGSSNCAICGFWNSHVKRGNSKRYR